MICGILPDRYAGLSAPALLITRSRRRVQLANYSAQITGTSLDHKNHSYLSNDCDPTSVLSAFHEILSVTSRTRIRRWRIHFRPQFRVESQTPPCHRAAMHDQLGERTGAAPVGAVTANAVTVLCNCLRRIAPALRRQT